MVKALAYGHSEGIFSYFTKNTMRVIAGTFRGRAIQTAKGQWLRPTTDKVRKHIFDSLGTLVQETKVLDLFAGTGSLGIEALSRGADKITFVDRSRLATSLIKKNLTNIQVTTYVKVICAEVLSYVRRYNDSPFDLIFADPPYEFKHYDELFLLISKSKIMTNRGIFLLECSMRNEFKLNDPALEVVRDRKIGDTRIMWFKNCGANI